MSNHHTTRYSARAPLLVFLGSWLLLFVLYFPATKAGFAGDYFKDWLQIIRNETFGDYINRPGTSTLYQFTQLVSYALYQVIGASRTGWHLVHVSMHALNCMLLFVFTKRLLHQAVISRGRLIAVFAAALFAVSPYNSEVVVHEPCLHYTIGLLLLLLPLIWLGLYFESGKRKYLIWSWLLYIPASFSLEVFYLTPVILLLFSWYYLRTNKDKGRQLRDVLTLLLAPMLLVLTVHLVIVRQFTDQALPHQVSSSPAVLLAGYASKVLKYLFHILLLGRFWPTGAREAVYQYASSDGVVVAFHLVLAACCGIMLLRKNAGSRSRLLVVLTLSGLLMLALVSPREFPSLQYVVFDRYHYFSLPFFTLAVLLVLFGMRARAIATLIFLAFLLGNTVLLFRINQKWQVSERVSGRLLESFPVANDKTILLLNVPENYHGLPMIGSNRESAMKVAYNMKHDQPVTGDVYDIASYNMNSEKDGAHVRVVNDSTVHVTLNQWGTWWWFHYIGAYNYENEVYRLNLTDPGHWYELTLKYPSDRLQLLFVNEGNWRTVNMQLRDADQY